MDDISEKVEDLLKRCKSGNATKKQIERDLELIRRLIELEKHPFPEKKYPPFLNRQAG